jgi:hypothetical protein
MEDQADTSTTSAAIPSATSWDPVNRPPMDGASQARVRSAQYTIALLVLADILIPFGDRTPNGQQWIFGVGLLCNVVFDIWAVVQMIRNRRKPGAPDIVARQELKWNMVQLVSMLVLFGELFWTESGRQVIFMLLLFWVPVGFGFSFYVMFKGIRDLLRRRRAGSQV